MSTELLAMLGGGASGFIFKLIGSYANSQTQLFEQMIKRQEAADASAQAASDRGGVWVRRAIVACVLFALIIAPLMVAYHGDVSVTVQKEGTGLLGWLGLSRGNWESLEGFVLLPEVRQAMLAIVGFYFGSSQVK